MHHPTFPIIFLLPSYVSSRLLNDPKMIFFIICLSIMFIGCYELLNHQTKSSIITICSYPLSMFFISCIILFVGYHNFMLGLLLLLCLAICFFPTKQILNTSLFHSHDKANNITHINEHVSDMNIENFQNKFNKKRKKKNTVKPDKHFMKDYFYNLYKEAQANKKNELNEGILENKREMLKNIKNKNNRESFENIDDIDEDEDEDDNTLSNNLKNNSDKTRNNRHSRQENFKSIRKRKLNPNDEDDTNLLLTKEILKDMINRIEFEYENREYLTKYISNRLEELIDIHKLADDEDDL